MAALTINRDLGDLCFSLSNAYLNNYKNSEFRPDLHPSKKPTISSMHTSADRKVSSNSASIICRYPKEFKPFTREVHGPCRKVRFCRPANVINEFLPNRVSNNQEAIGKMGNCIAFLYDGTRSDASRHSKRDKIPVIDVDAECSKNVISNGSSIQEIEALDDGREACSVVSDWRSNDCNADVLPVGSNVNFPTYDREHGEQLSSSTVSELTEVHEVEKMMASLSVSPDLGMPPHKRLHDAARRRDPILRELDFHIKHQERKRLQQSQEKKPAERIRLPVEPFVPLTHEEEVEVSRALSDSNRWKVLVAHANSNIEITVEILRCLNPGAWLNDEVINVYLELLKERELREPTKFLKCHFFNTFFYKKLICGKDGYDFKAVRRWTNMRKIGYGLVECDKIFVPIHKDIHWCLAVINKKDEKFQYLDSLKGRDFHVLKVLARYFVDEVKDKSGKDIDISSWKHECVDSLAEQQNGSDCGMFMLKYVDFYSRGLNLCFSQEHMRYFRLRTAKEILKLKAE